ncbi:MAG TPA: outer membrane beta-barrel protein [Chitinophagaceae bacterium]
MNKQSFKGLLLVAGIMAAVQAGAQDKRGTLPNVKDTTGVSVHVMKNDTLRYGIVSVIQIHKREGDSTRPEIKTKLEIGHHYGKNNSAVSLSWFDIDLGFNNYVDNSAYGTAAVNNFAPIKPGEPPVTAAQFALRPGKSVNVNIWPLLAYINLADHHLFLKTGIGIEMNNYRYAKNISYVNDYAGTYVIRDSVNFKKNKLFTEYLTVPLMLKFTTGSSKDNSFRIAFGATFGYLVKDRTKQISSERGKVKNNDEFNLEKYRVGLRGELGFGPVTLYGSYSLTPIHQYGLKQYPFSIGIVL